MVQVPCVEPSEFTATQHLEEEMGQLMGGEMRARTLLFTLKSPPGYRDSRAPCEEQKPSRVGTRLAQQPLGFCTVSDRVEKPHCPLLDDGEHSAKYCHVGELGPRVSAAFVERQSTPGGRAVGVMELVVVEVIVEEGVGVEVIVADEVMEDVMVEDEVMEDVIVGDGVMEDVIVEDEVIDEVNERDGVDE